MGIKKELEVNSSSKSIKNSSQSTSLEQFVHEIYEKIIDVNELKVFALIENLKMLA